LKVLLPAYGDGTGGSREAIASGCEMLEERYSRARCDSDGVSGCIRCNTMFLVSTLTDLLAATAAKADAFKSEKAATREAALASRPGKESEGGQ
jgi:hypothetical protein